MNEQRRWYVATMNDCIFIVDKQPSPSNEYMRFGGDDDVMVISMRSGSREAQQIAEEIAAAHNAALELSLDDIDREAASTERWIESDLRRRRLTGRT